MKTVMKVLFWFTLIILTSVTSCNHINSNDEFVKKIKVKNVIDINQSISLLLDPYQPSNLKIGEAIYFQILNQSNKNIRFSEHANIQLFVLEEENNNWKEVQNSVEYQGKGDVIVPKGEDGLHDTFIPVKPVMENDGKVKTIRVVVTGILMEDGTDTDKAVSAYKDLAIQP